MKKIPTLFMRDTDNMKRVTSEVNPECQWVLDGEGIATRKYDGTCCLVRDGKLYKRREIKEGKEFPSDFETAGYDEVTGKTVGWVPVGDGPEDRWYRAAVAGIFSEWSWNGGDPPKLPRTINLPNATYELCGPKVQGNPEGFKSHRLISHAGAENLDREVPRNFDALREFMADGFPHEGVVWHHPDGRMAKLKRRDFQ